MASQTSEMLPPETKVITTEVLEAALRRSGETNAIVQTFDIELAANKGDNYSTAVFIVNAEAKIGEEQVKRFSLFFKTCFDVQFLRDLVFRGDFFTRETEAYCKVIPSLVQFQRELNVSTLMIPSVAKFYHGETNYKEKNGYLILENLKSHGYKLPDVKKGLDFRHCELVMKELATIHAMSFAMKNGDKENIRRKSGDSVFQQIRFAGMFKDIAEKSIIGKVNKIVNSLKELTDDENVKKGLDKILDVDAYEVFGNQFTPKEPYSVLCHGDAWCNNMMFKYNPVENSEGGAPIDVKLVDLQVMCYALPTADLVYFFCTSTTRETRKKYLKQLLHYYHVVFHSVLASVKFECPDFTLDVLEEMYKDGALFGFLYGSVTSLTFLANKEVIEDHGREAKDGKFLNDKPENLNESSRTLINLRLLDYMDEAVELGII